jgi:hypothetical protein
MITTTSRVKNSLVTQKNVSYIIKHKYHSYLIPEGVAEPCQIFLRDAHVLPKLLVYEEQCRRDRW